jgi:hypothetical protein
MRKICIHIKNECKWKLKDTAGLQVLLRHSSRGYSGLDFDRSPLSTRQLGVCRNQRQDYRGSSFAVDRGYFCSVYGILPIQNAMMWGSAVLLPTNEVPKSNLGRQIISPDREFRGVPQSLHWHTSILP